MTINEYQELAMTTLNREMGKTDMLINGVMGLCKEAGDAIDIVKNYLAQGHRLDKEQLIDELGDIALYIAETAAVLDVDLETVLSNNIEKFKETYPDDPDSKKSINRKDIDVIGAIKYE